MINKKGNSISIGVFVLIVLALYGMVIFNLSQNIGKVTSIVEDARFVDEAYAKENEIDFFVKFIWDELEMEVSLENESIEGVELADKTSELFISRLEEKVAGMSRDNIPLKEFAERVEMGKFNFDYNESAESYVFEMRDFLIIGDLVDIPRESGLLFDPNTGKRWFWREVPEDYSHSEDRFISGIIYRGEIVVMF